MSANSGYSTTAQWEEMPEEAMARAEAQLAALAETADGFWGNYGWLIFFGAMITLVGLMLLYLYGKSRRENSQRNAVQASPLFDEVTDDTLNDMDRDLERPFAYADREDDAELMDQDIDDVPRQGAFAAAPPIQDDDILDTDFADTTLEPAIEEPDDMVAAEQDDPHEAFAVPEPELDERPRYSFASGRPSGDANATFSRPKTEPAPPTMPLRDSLRSSAAAIGDDDHGRPFIAPFIREDIDRSERRQADRIDTLRDEVSRQVQTLKSEQASRLDLVIAAIDRKLESLDKRQAQAMVGRDAASEKSASVHVSSLTEQVDRISSAIDGQGQRIRAITTILENRFGEVTKVYDEIRGMHGDIKSVRLDMGRTSEAVSHIKGELDEVKEHVGRLERAILDRAAQDSSTIVRLTDVIRGTLPDGTYSFGATLANGESADCLIHFDGLKEKVAIDAGFPMEAFHELPSRDAVRRNLPQAKVSEDAFRRAILRAILEAADRCISPAETADSCLLFLPSEAAYTILHDRFPDLVRDSQRARVWLVSPSTLMGTLNLIRNLLPDATDLEARAADAKEAASRRNEESRLRQEVDSLRRRATGLAEELDRTRGTLRDLISSTEKLNFSSETSDLGDPIDELPADDDDGIIEGLRFDGTPEWQPAAPKKREARSSKALFEDERPDPLR